MKKELISNGKLAEYFEQEGVTLRQSKHIKLQNPEFKTINIVDEPTAENGGERGEQLEQEETQNKNHFNFD